ncbi:MAG: TIGR02996 domain-containing protein [Gemmataceae bacterium]
MAAPDAAAASPGGAPRPELVALLADARRDPFDDGLRLILADWLDDHGTPAERARAEFIRCQVEYCRRPGSDPRHPESVRRAYRLQEQNDADWLGSLRNWCIAWTHHRGLLSLTVRCPNLTTRSFAALAATEAWAWVEELVLHDTDPNTLGRLRDSPLAATISALGFTPLEQAGRGPLQVLARTPWLGNLVRLDLSNQSVTPPGLALLLQSPQLRQLRVLNLAANGLQPEAADPLMLCQVRLRELTLWGNRLGDEGVGRLAVSDVLRELRKLDLRGNEVGDGGAVALARSQRLASLQELNLADNRIGPLGALALARSAWADQLTSLTLWGNPIGPEATDQIRARLGSRVHIV